MGSDERLTMTVKECSAALSLSENTIYALLRAGKIPCIRLNRRLIIPRKRFERFLDGDGGNAGMKTDVHEETNRIR